MGGEDLKLMKLRSLFWMEETGMRKIKIKMTREATGKLTNLTVLLSEKVSHVIGNPITC